jgi:predicted metal-dependent hydrolase
VSQGRDLPIHSVRESSRAKHVHLRFSLRDGLEVVVPPQFDRSEIPELLRRKERWIARVGRELDEQRALLDPRPRDKIPRTIEIRSVDETWRLDVVPGGARLEVRESDGLRLCISGPVGNPERWRTALRLWMARRARSHLVEWAEREALEHHLRHGPVSIRWQKTRWGSCSRRNSASGRSAPPRLSLNAGLLFLPPHLVRYVILHELCHTERMDHSPAFWKRLEGMEPAARELRDELRSAWRYVPSWCEGMPTPREEPDVDSSQGEA